MEVVVRNGKKVEVGVPFSLTKTAISLEKFVEEVGANHFSLYVGTDDSPYGIVWVRGDMNMVLSGIHGMISNICQETGKSEKEVVKMILDAKPTNVETHYH